MSVKSGLGKSTDLNTTEDLQINEILLNKINEYKLSSKKFC